MTTTTVRDETWRKILADIDAVLPDVTALRRDVHRHPEIGFRETRTAALVAERLRAAGLEVHEGIGKTGVVATLRGRPGPRAVALRADMDALAITEAGERDHASCHPGLMHACGHDGHTAMLLGAALVLTRTPDFAGTVHFVFQPAEEGLGGAAAMLADGLLERFPVDAVFGLHNKPGLPHGSFHVTAGPILAASDTFTVHFGGNGGHGGSGPHLSIDPTLAAAQFVTNLQSVVGRNVASHDRAVLSVGHIAGGSHDAPNVIPTSVVVRGTARSFRPETRDLLERRLRELAEAAAAAFGTTLRIVYDRQYPATVNDPEATRRAAAVARAIVGEAKVDTALTPGMGAEDFSFVLERVPGCFMFLGQGEGPALHTAGYDFDDRLLPVGMRYWSRLALAELAA
jgi:hippurate hydrolase